MYSPMFTPSAKTLLRENTVRFSFLPFLQFLTATDPNVPFFLLYIAVSFKFCRIGDDQGAKDLLQELDDHKDLGVHIDCQRGMYSA